VSATIPAALGAADPLNPADPDACTRRRCLSRRPRRRPERSRRPALVLAAIAPAPHAPAPAAPTWRAAGSSPGVGVGRRGGLAIAMNRASPRLLIAPMFAM